MTGSSRSVLSWYSAKRAAAATISQLPSAPGNQPTGLWRSTPLLAPTVVSTRAFGW
ncbi:hypothetical protein [Phytohabitans rumicis]|uniref:hypothetical protein n=1 Tax=Phytohabitans rumicis TaxID=1076125 RepID=UPI0031ED57FE